MTDATDSVIAARQYTREKLAGRKADPSALLTLSEDLTSYVTGDTVNTDALDRWIEANSTAPAPTNGRVPGQGQRGPSIGSAGSEGRAEAQRRFGDRANGTRR
jgi:hypothetical protein